ncbi:mitochondrial carrier [Fomitiporia mediterranea MF3/22]|uniref:mitochondrial carrier n=1 Tax=Fomitiporia mediterranea (strain MF3/22) TaxID=694068 RepID=UPI0004407960|nr:mitochondrial carrier [Fomitiporia mediterranea MF3/22]EJD03864.1 mitochondrial carrier [Fomitiporia mediterranea MF3/22]
MDPFNAKLVAAATGSTLTALTMTPFDVVKTRLQTQPPPQIPLFPKPPTPNGCCQPNSALGCVRNMSSYARPLATEVVCIWDHGVLRTERVNGFWDAIRHVVRAEGMKGLWKGAGTTLLIGVPSSTFYMMTYDHLLRVTLPPISPWPSLTPLFAGIIARSFISTLGSPLELIRTNLQSTPISPDTPHTLRSVLVSIREVAQRQGPLSLWRGVGPTLWRDVPFSGIYWAGYERLKRILEGRGFHGAPAAFVSGAVSGTTAAIIVSPFDTAKTRRQALVMSSISGGSSAPSTSVVSVLKEVVRTEGVSGLFAGLTPRMAKIAPACGIMIACFEGIGKVLAKPLDS